MQLSLCSIALILTFSILSFFFFLKYILEPSFSVHEYFEGD
jgi:hypothetical protein